MATRLPLRKVSWTQDRCHIADFSLIVIALAAGALVVVAPSNLSSQGTSTGWKVISWNNLGMHCLDADFGVFAILPPYNTI